MTVDIPEIDQDQAQDIYPDLKLYLVRGDTPASEDMHTEIRDAFDIRAAFGDGNDHNALTFKTYKTDPAADLLISDNYEVVARWWDPRRKAELEPPNHRFKLLTFKDDLADTTNVVEFVCAGTSWLTEKIRVRVMEKYATAFALNRDYDQAKAAYEDAERDYDSVLRQFENVGRQIQEDIWPGISHGPIFAVRGVAWVARDGRARWRSLLSNHAYNGEVWWYSQDQGRFVKMNMNTGSTTLQNRKQSFRDLGPQVYNARQRMNRMRSAYAAAERAARETSRNGTRFFYNRTVGRVLSQLWVEAGERDAGYVNHGEGSPGWADSPYPLRRRRVKGLWRGWGFTHDSKGAAWTSNTPRKNWELSLGSSFWDALQDFRERGIIDWTIRGTANGGGGRTLDVVPAGGLEVDQSRRVLIRLDDCLEAKTTVSVAEHQTVTFVQDFRGLNHYTVYGRENPDRQTPWGLLEGAMTEPGAETLDEVLDLTRPRRQELSNRFVINATRRFIVRPWLPIPMLDYEPHHRISVEDHDGPAQVRKINQIIVEKLGNNQPIIATVRLGTRRSNRPQDFSKTISKILGGADHLQGHIPMDPTLEPSQIPQDALFAPAISGLGARVAFTEAGRPQVMLTAQLAVHDLPEPDDSVRFDDAPASDEYVIPIEYEGA